MSVALRSPTLKDMSGDGYRIGPGVVPLSAVALSDSYGWAPASECVSLESRRVLYRVRDGHEQPVAVLGEEQAGDLSTLPAIIASLEEPRPVDPARLVSLREMAPRLRITPQTLYRWSHISDFPAPKILRPRRWDSGEILEWAARRAPYGRIPRRDRKL